MLLLKPVGFATLTAATSGSFVGYGDGTTGGLGSPEADFGNLNLALQFVRAQGRTVHYIYTSGTTLSLWISGTGELNGTTGLDLNIGAQSYSFSSAALAFTGGHSRYSWNGATALTNGTAYPVSID